jgi:DNA replication protein DnaC
MTKFNQELRNQVEELKHNIIGRCKICHGKGTITDSHDDQMYSNCKCKIIFRYLSRLTKALIPSDYWALDYDDLQLSDEVRDKTSTFIAHLDRAHKLGLGLIFQGNNGVGKTSVACEIGKAAIVQGFSVRYFTLAAYVDATFAKNEDLIDYYEQGQFLIIDEVDKCSNKIKVMMDNLFRRLFNMRKVVICATNADRDTLDALLGKSIVSLLKRHCMRLIFDGEDYSEVVEDNFESRLLGEFNYYAPAIKKMAYDFEKFDLNR